MKNIDKQIHVTHINIRTSISFLLLKLLVIEVIAAIFVIMTSTAMDFEILSLLQLSTGLFNIPVYLFFVSLKSILTIFIILQWLNDYYEISSQNVIHRSGILFRHDEKYPLSHMKVIDVQQSLMGRILNYGTIYLHDAFKTEQINMYQIHNPIRYASILEDLLDDEVETIREVRRHGKDPDDADISVN